MINLLPVEEKNRIRSLYRRRATIVSFAMLSVLFFAVAVGLVPSFLNALAKRETAESRTEKMNTEADAKLLFLSQETNKRAGILLEGEKGEYPSELFLAILSRRPDGIQITDIAYEGVGTGNSAKRSPTVSFSGVAKSRDTLLSFATMLESDSPFSGMDIPISSFVKDSNLPFSMRLEVKRTTP